MSEFIPTSTAHYASNNNHNHNGNISKGIIARDSFSGSPDDQFLFNPSRVFADQLKKDNTNNIQQDVVYNNNNEPVPI